MTLGHKNIFMKWCGFNSYSDKEIYQKVACLISFIHLMHQVVEINDAVQREKI